MDSQEQTQKPARSMIYGDRNSPPQWFNLREAIDKAEADGMTPQLVEILRRLDGRLQFIEGVVQNSLLTRGG